MKTTVAGVIFMVACCVFVLAIYGLAHGTATVGSALAFLVVILACEKILKRV